jgi:hypothetical protein
MPRPTTFALSQYELQMMGLSPDDLRHPILLSNYGLGHFFRAFDFWPLPVFLARAFLARAFLVRAFLTRVLLARILLARTLNLSLLSLYLPSLSTSFRGLLIRLIVFLSILPLTPSLVLQ